MQKHTFSQLAFRAAGVPLGRLILACDRNSTAGLLMIGMSSVMRGDFARAEGALSRLLELDPATVHGRLWLSRAALGARRLADAMKFALEAEKIEPGNPLLESQLRECEAAAVRFVPLEFCEQTGAAAPKPAITCFGLGMALWGLGRSLDAVRLLEQAIEADPLYVPAIRELFRMYSYLDDPQNELRLAEMAVRVAPDASANADLALLMIKNGKKDDAEALLTTATAMAPDNPGVLATAGFVRLVLGNDDEAVRCLTASIERMPRQGDAYYFLSQCRRATEMDRAMVDRMTDLLSDAALSPPERESLAYAVGKSFEDLGEYERAMQHFEEANELSYRLKFGSRRYCVKDDVGLADRTRKLMSVRPAQNSPVADGLSPAPIFIVGMIRSGTTLMEQILSSHPRVGAAGEQSFWANHYDELCGDTPPAPERLRELCGEYCATLKVFGGDSKFVTDKRPGNYVFLGSLVSAFRQAKFIHMKRHPADNCLSIFTTRNTSPMSWAHSKENIAGYYRLYCQLMEDWHKVLPPGRLLDVSYEELIDDTERVVKEVCAFCELEWDPAMLRPEDNPRAVVTPSLGQVRRPIYRSSVARWKRYEPWLGEILTLVPPAEKEFLQSLSAHA